MLAVHATVLTALSTLLAALTWLLLTALMLLTRLTLPALLLAGLALPTLLWFALLVLRVARVLLFVRHFDVLHTVLEAPVPPENNAQAVVQFLMATPRISAKVCKITRK